MILSEFRPLAASSIKNGRLSFNTSRSACLTVSFLSFENLLKMETIISMLELSEIFVTLISKEIWKK
jgi:hypothetical protein